MGGRARSSPSTTPCWPTPRRPSTGCTRPGPARQPVVVALGVDPATFREPPSIAVEPWRLAARHRAVARPPALPGVGQHLRRPRRRPGVVVGPQGAPGSTRRGATPRRAGRRRAARRHAGLGRRRPRGAARRRWPAGGRRPRESVERGQPRRSCPPPVGARRRPRPRPARRRRPRRRAGPGHRPGRIGQDPGAHRAAAPPRRRPRLRAGGRARRRLQQARPSDEMAARTAGVRRPHPHAQRPRPAASSPQHRGGAPPVLDEREVRATARARWCPGRRPAGQHRPARRPTSRRCRRPPRAARPRRRSRTSAATSPGSPRRSPPTAPSCAAGASSTSTSRSTLAVEAAARATGRSAGRCSRPVHRHLLVDEFQDLTPAHVLLVRLLSAARARRVRRRRRRPVIYGHAGADPRVPHRLRRAVPGRRRARRSRSTTAARPPVVDARPPPARPTTTVRVAKVDPAPARRPTAAAGACGSCEHAPDDGGRGRLVDVVRGLARRAGASSPATIAVLARVNSLLLAPHVALAEAGVPVARSCGPTSSTAPGCGRARLPAHRRRRPTRVDPATSSRSSAGRAAGLPQWFDEVARAGAARSTTSQRAADRIDDVKVAGKVGGLADDLARLSRRWPRDGTTRGRARGGPRRRRPGRGDEPARPHRRRRGRQPPRRPRRPAPGGRPAPRPGRVRAVAAGGVPRAERDPDGRHAVDDPPGQGPGVGPGGGVRRHRGRSSAPPGRGRVEEERRVLHVAITRSSTQTVVLFDASRPSPFLASSTGPLRIGRRGL